MKQWQAPSFTGCTWLIGKYHNVCIYISKDNKECVWCCGYGLYW